MMDTRSLERARDKFPSVPDDVDEPVRNLLETAIMSLVALQMSATATALQLCRRPDADAAIDELALTVRNHVSTFHHTLEVYRSLRDKPEMVS